MHVHNWNPETEAVGSMKWVLLAARTYAVREARMKRSSTQVELDVHDYTQITV